MPAAGATPSLNPATARQQGAQDAAKTVGLKGPPAPSVPSAPAAKAPDIANQAATRSPGFMAPPRSGATSPVGASPSQMVAAQQVPGAPKFGAFSLEMNPEKRRDSGDAEHTHVRQPPNNERDRQGVPAAVQTAFQYLEQPSESDPYTIPSYVP